jgi:folate-binding protein YgfZ
VCYLPELGVLRFNGPDVANFLQGYLTCDTVDLAPAALAPMAICNLKGRVVVNGWCRRWGEGSGSPSVILIVHRSLIERLMQFFKAYVMFSKTELADASDTTLVFGSTGNADQPLILVDQLTEAKTLWEQSPHASVASFWLGLIEAGIALVTEATSEAFLPQMLDLERLGAVDFDKGCYLGQEVVARAQHRGEVKRRLQRLDWTGTAPPAGAQFGTPADPARKLGTIVNSSAGPATAHTAPTAGAALAVVANDAPGPFQLGDTVLTRVA